LISIVSFLFGEFVVPAANLRRTEIKQEEIRKRSSKDQGHRKDIYLQDSRQRLVYVREFEGKTNLARGVLIQEYEGEKLVERIDAETMTWGGAIWTLHKAEIRIFQGDQEQFQNTEEWPRPDLTFTPEDLAQRPKDPEQMNILELKAYIRHVKRLGGDAQRWMADFHLKIAFPFANTIIVLFGTALALMGRRSGAAVGFGISLFICFVYYAVLEAGRAFGRAGDLPPVVAAWIGNAVFGLIGLSLLLKSRK
jgi:lipopolysaccharide export system permease protein